MGGSGTGIVWLRRDLRIRDHPALRAALERHKRVVPVFCFDDRLLHGRHASGPRTQFLLECLADLDSELRERGSGLVIRRGKPERELVQIARELGAETVHFTRDVSPFGRQRGERCRVAFESAGIESIYHPGLNAVDDLREIRTLKDTPYTVFSPFHRNWLGVERRNVLEAPREMPPLPSKLAKGRLPSLEALGLEQEVSEPARGGESEALKTLDRFLDGPVREYTEIHNALGEDKTSRLSPYLHFGCISPRQIEDRLPSGNGPEAFRRQLCWRDFYHHVLLFHPQNAKSEFQERYRGKIRWSYAEKRFERWCEGQTGFPLVDAGMRQLKREGWMHNRARLVVGSFLTKDLGIDWRWGERHFMRHLIDGDEANNNGNWQWIASVGVDPQPPYRRIYNPALHMERYDPDGEYVRRYVPELESVPDKYLAEPWEMPPEVQEECGVLIGKDYPEPMLDRRKAREEALDRYRV
ncbi:MAG: deoxyribodipyrimidine photo-lyase [Solirubrobacterales bacterium]